MSQRVLLAEPDPVLRAAYQAFLAAEGVQAIAVTNGADVRAALEGAAPAVLILDPDPPDRGVGGLELLRDAGEACAVRVLILTAHPEALTGGAVPRGDYGVLLKPVPPATVAGVIRSLVEPG
jgi:DNA-binding response OmpR family regulator